MTADEREELARRFGYRDPFRMGDLVGTGAMVMLPVVSPVLGLVALISGDSTGQRVGGALLLAAGAAALVFAWRYFVRPVRPDNDDDLERELRYRLQVEADSRGR